MKTVAEISERDLTIEKNKAAMRKKRRKLKMKRRLIVFVFVFLCAGVILTVLKAPFFNITTIECVGQEKLTREQIMTAAEVRTGANIFSVNIEAMKRKVAAIPSVDQSNVRRIFPNKIKIWVRECKEAAYIALSGELAVVDTKGKIIRIAPDEEETRVTMAEILGVAPVSDMPGTVISAEDDIVAMQAYKCLEILGETGLLEKTKLIDLSDMSDFKIGYDNRLEIFLGNQENMEYKLRFVSKVIDENISDYEKAKLDYRGDKLYVGAPEDETALQNEETKSADESEKDEDAAEEKDETETTDEKHKESQDGQ